MNSRRKATLALALALALCQPCFAPTDLDSCRRYFRAASMPYDPYYIARFSDVEGPARPDIQIMSMTQATVGNQEKLRSYRAQLETNTFDYTLTDNIISGVWHEPTNTFYVNEGHHRLAAALEIAAETGNWSPFKKLIQHGQWDVRLDLPQDRLRLPGSPNLSRRQNRDLIGPLTPARQFPWNLIPW